MKIVKIEKKSLLKTFNVRLEFEKLTPASEKYPISIKIDKNTLFFTCFGYN